MSSRASPRERWPRATYRVQLHRGFGFADAAAILPYLDALGISHCYCSPYLKSRSGSRHGYDIIDHDALDPEIGSSEDFEHFCRTLDAHEMEQIMDIVPNHMAVMGRDNPWWLDVLENGPASEFADFFDIDWQPLRKSLTGKVLLPVLGAHYGTVIEGAELELTLDRERGTFAVAYHEHLFPIDPREYPRILLARIEPLRTHRDAAADIVVSLESLATAFANLPGRLATDQSSLVERRRDKEVHKRRLAELLDREAVIGEYVGQCLDAFNGDPRDPARIARMHELLEAQAYRLAYWRVASHEINYRRFFDVNDLACLRMEDPMVFEATHRLVLELVGRGAVGGLRIDHPDGLFDPARYLRRLTDAIHTACDERPNAGRDTVYVAAEKILAHGESLPANWRVHGTTGYEFADLVARLFVHPNGMPRLSAAYEEFVDEPLSFGEIAYQAKRLTMQTSLASELNVLVAELDRIADADPHTRDFGLGGLRSALLEVIACLPVYRCYVSSATVAEADAAFVTEAIDAAKRRTEAADTSVFDFLGDVLTLRLGSERGPEYRSRLLRFVMKLQQYTGPVAAKGVEDTAFYRHARLISLNEVGCHVDSGSLSIEAFHRASKDRLKTWPHSMLASSTHDSKRSEDARTRISVLAELAPEWTTRVARWREINAAFKQPTGDGRTWPDANLEYFLYQTLIGAWPLGSAQAHEKADFLGRMQAYIQKAIKEAKTHTSWINPNDEYEQAVEQFITAMLDRTSNAEFLDDFEEFQNRVSTIGLYTSLSQTLLKMTAPGVPDIYQGNELWTFDLVDPDNRRPVDFERRRDTLAALRDRDTSEALARALLENLEDGAAKLYVVLKALALRRQQPGLFSDGEYIPLIVKGELQVYLCAFARREAERTVIVLAPRWFATLTEGATRRPLGADVWKDTSIELPESDAAFCDLFTGTEFAPAREGAHRDIAVGRLLEHFPVGLLYASSMAPGTDTEDAEEAWRA